MPPAENHRVDPHRAHRHRVGPTDEAYLLMEQALGLTAPMQIAWVFDRDPGESAVAGFTTALAYGRLDRTLRRRRLPAARHRWRPAVGPLAPRVDPTPIGDDEVHVWTVAHMESTELDALSGRAWQVATARTRSGRRVVSLICSHVLADGARFVAEAAHALAHASDAASSATAASLGRDDAASADTDPARRRDVLGEDARDAAAQLRAAAAAARRLVRSAGSAGGGEGRIARPPSRPVTPRDRPVMHLAYTVDREDWSSAAAAHGGTDNTLFAGVIAGIARRAGLPADPLTVSIAVDGRTPDRTTDAADRRDSDRDADDDVANAAGGVWIRVTDPVEPRTGLTKLRATMKQAITATADGAVTDGSTRDAAATGDDLAQLARLLPRRVLARVMAAVPAPAASVSNLGVAPGELVHLDGVRASGLMIRAATRPIPAKLRRTVVPGIAAWWVRTDDTVTVAICAAHPDHLGDDPHTLAVVDAEFARWGLTTRRWGEVVTTPR